MIRYTLIYILEHDYISIESLILSVKTLKYSPLTLCLTTCIYSCIICHHPDNYIKHEDVFVLMGLCLMYMLFTINNTKTVLLALLLWIHSVDLRKDTICSSIINTIQVDLKLETHMLIDCSSFCCFGFFTCTINNLHVKLSWPHLWGHIWIHPHKKEILENTIENYMNVFK